MNMLRRMKNKECDIPDWLNLSPECAALVRRLLEPEPAQRVSLKEVMEVRDAPPPLPTRGRGAAASRPTAAFFIPSSRRRWLAPPWAACCQHERPPADARPRPPPRSMQNPWFRVELPPNAISMNDHYLTLKPACEQTEEQIHEVVHAVNGDMA
jgi:hypothetical protein